MLVFRDSSIQSLKHYYFAIFVVIYLKKTCRKVDHTNLYTTFNIISFLTKNKNLIQNLCYAAIQLNEESFQHLAHQKHSLGVT